MTPGSDRLAREGRRGCIALFVTVALLLTMPLWVPMLPIDPHSAKWDRFGLVLLFFALLAMRCRCSDNS